MSFAAPKSLFYNDYTIPTLELKGNYEMWVLDVQNYFEVSRLPAHFSAICDNTEPDIRADYEPEDIPEKKKKRTKAKASTSSTSASAIDVDLDEEEKTEEIINISLKARHSLIMSQSRFVLWKGIGESIKRECDPKKILSLP
jgi:hypothetical protein